MTHTHADMPASAALQKQLAQIVFSALSATRWSASTATYIQTGRSQSLSVVFFTPEGDRDSLAIGRDVTDPWAEMRRVMSHPEKGAWLASQMMLELGGSYRFTFDYDRRPYKGSAGLFEAPAIGVLVRPTDEQWREDFDLYPRTVEYTPAWLSAGAWPSNSASGTGSRGDSTDSVVIPSALSAQVSWPAHLLFLDGRWGWGDVFGSVADHTVERLRSGSDYVSVLADEGRRSEWGGWLESVAQEVLADVYAEILERRDVAVVVRLWRILEAGGVVSAPDGLDSLDETATVGSITARRPVVVEKILSDILDSVTDIIDQQLFDRFGERVEA